jgi:hypothetical protein
MKFHEAPCQRSEAGSSSNFAGQARKRGRHMKQGVGDLKRRLSILILKDIKERLLL